MKKLTPVFFLAFIILNGCGSNAPSTTSPTTVAQDKAFIRDITNSTNDCINNARDGQLAQSIIDFIDLSNGVSANDQWATDMSNALDNTMGTIQTNPNSNRFEFSSYCGVYTWNPGPNNFIKSFNSSGIFIKFPSTPTSASNDVTIQLTNYTDALHSINAENVYLPLPAVGKITKGTTEIATLNFSANYSTVGFPTPIDVSYTIFLAPHSYDFTIHQVNSKEFNFASHIFSGAGCGISINANVAFNYSDYDNFVLKDYLKTIQATYQNGSFIIKSNFNALTYYLLNNNSTINLNSTLTNEVYNGSDKIADLKFMDVNFERRLFIYYKDGTSEDTFVYYDPFINNLKSMLRYLFGNDVDNWF